MTEKRKPPRIGFIGTGFMGEVHARAARQAGAQLVAAASRSAENAEHFAMQQGFTRSGNDPFAVIEAPDIDVVHVLSPNTTHMKYAAAALRAGKHVVCEKPLATDPAAADDLARLAAESGLVATVPFVYRFHPMVREARARVLRGDVGRLLTFSGGYLQDWLHSPDATNWRVGGDLGGSSRAVADIGSHLLDLLEFVTGDRVTTIDARLLTAYGSRSGVAVDTEDAATILVGLAGGAVGNLSVSQVALGHDNDLSLELSGTAQALSFRQETPDILTIHSSDGTRSISRGSAGLSSESERLSIVPAGHPMGYQDAFNAFVADAYAAIAGETPDGLPTFADGLRSAQLVDAVLASSRTRSTIRTDDEAAAA